MSDRVYYVYMSFEEFGRAYIGYRKCPEGHTPESDPYMGSFRDKTFKPTRKEILAVFDNDTDAINLEIQLHKAYDVANNRDFANLCNQLSDKVRAPHHLNESTKRKLSEINSGPNNPNYGRRGPDHWHYGKTWSEEHKRKISEGGKGREFSSEVRDKIKNSNIKTKESKSIKFDWVNKITSQVELQKSIMYMSRTFSIKEKQLRRCAKGGTCKNIDWKLV